jgi:glucokinase
LSPGVEHKLNYLGFDLGGSGIKAGLMNSNHTMIEEFKLPFDANVSNPECIHLFSQIIQLALKHGSIQKIGIGAPGPLSTDSGILTGGNNLGGIRDLNIKEELEDRFKIPVTLNNDANCAALALSRFAEGRSHRSIFVYTLGTGVGGGWVFQNKLFNGHDGNSMEVGHVPLVRGGRLCGCGKFGCLEAYFSTRGLKTRVQDETGKMISSVEEIIQEIQNGDLKLQNIFQEGLEYLAMSAIGIVHLLNVDAIFFVGGITQSWSYFGESLTQTIRRGLFSNLEERLYLGVGSPISGIYGALALAMEEL